MLRRLMPFAVTLWNDGRVSRAEGVLLVAVGIGLMAWLRRRSPVFLGAIEQERPASASSRLRALGLLALGVGAMLVGAELVVLGSGESATALSWRGGRER